MGTRLYIEFNTPEDEAAFFHTTVEGVRNAREEYKRWQSIEPDLMDPQWSSWYNSLSSLAREIDDNKDFGLGRLEFDPSEIVPGTKEYAGVTYDREQMCQLLSKHSASCRCDDGSTYRAIHQFRSLKSVSWG